MLKNQISYGLDTFELGVSRYSMAREGAKTNEDNNGIFLDKIKKGVKKI